MPLKFKNRETWLLPTIGGVAIIIAVVLTSLVSWLLYEHTVNLLTDNLRQRLLSIAITQASNIDAKEVNALKVEDDWKKPEWSHVVSGLKKAKEANPNIVFMYIFRKTEADPTQMEFVADAESINPYANTDDDPNNDVDANGDGLVEADGADQLQWPGQEYPEPPEETFAAYNGPLTNKELYADAYGQVLTGYAPIKDNSGNIVAILGVDIKANDFFTVTRQTLYPFLMFIIFLGLAIVMLSMGLIRIWGNRLNFLRELDSQKNKVISIVAHQLNTPITTVQWAVELLRSGDNSKEESADLITGGVSQIKSLAEMFLQAAHIQQGKLQIKNLPVDLNAFFAQLKTTASILAQKKKIHFMSEIADNLPTALLDEKYTQVTVENLLSNAIKYTPEGGNVYFKAYVKNNTLFCSVKDTGIGIPKADQGKIFGQMYRASNVTKPGSSIDGNGLGLYAAKGVIEAQGGKISFVSTEGTGTEFFIELPLKLEEKKTN